LWCDVRPFATVPNRRCDCTPFSSVSSDSYPHDAKTKARMTPSAATAVDAGANSGPSSAARSLGTQARRLPGGKTGLHGACASNGPPCSRHRSSEYAHPTHASREQHPRSPGEQSQLQEWFEDRTELLPRCTAPIHDAAGAQPGLPRRPCRCPSRMPEGCWALRERRGACARSSAMHTPLSQPGFHRADRSVANYPQP
jgi:hypothetical protein